MDKQGSLWFLAGLGCGAVVGLLYAPRPGTHTRAIAASKAKQARQLFERETGESPSNVNPEPRKPASSARQASERISRALDAGRHDERS